MANKDFTVKNGLVTGANNVTIGSNVFIIASNGNIGVGTTATSNVLTVNGNCNFIGNGNFTGIGTFSGVSMNGANVGFMEMPQNNQSSSYTTVLSDSGKHIIHPSSDNNPRTFTIASNASVPYPIGTVITFINMVNTLTISINSDTLYASGSGGTGNRTLSAYGMASAVKIDTTTWIISGINLL